MTLRPPADALVHAFKYEGWAELAPVLGARVADVVPRAARTGDPVVTAVPTTKKRLRSRGYNQAELLAREVARRLEVPLVTVLARRDGGGSQVSLHPVQRRANVARAFTVDVGGQGEGAVDGRSVVLVDDVLTTGATACAAAHALERAGASGVTVVAFARALSLESGR